MFKTFSRNQSIDSAQSKQLRSMADKKMDKRRKSYLETTRKSLGVI